MSSDEPKVVTGSASARVEVTASATGFVAYSPESYRRFAEETGFRQESLEKVIRLGQLLGQIHSDPRLSGKLVLKGGTALNLIQNPIRRLSVDLDFNYIGAVEREAMLAEKPGVIEAVIDVARSQRLDPGTPRDSHGGTQFPLRYTNSLGTPDNIKIDLNWITRVPLLPPAQVALWQPPGVGNPTTDMVSSVELACGKLRALVDRVAARDAFDAPQLPVLFEESWPPVGLQDMFVFYSGTLDYPLTDFNRDRLDELSQSEVEDSLWPMLQSGNRPSKDDLIGRAKEILDPLLELNDNQLEFIESLQLGDFHPEILFPDDPETAERLAMHPALLWKAQNAKQHSAKSKK